MLTVLVDYDGGRWFENVGKIRFHVEKGRFFAINTDISTRNY